MDDFKLALYEGTLVSFGKTLARLEPPIQSQIMRDIGGELLDFLNRRGLGFTAANHLSDLTALIRAFVAKGFAKQVEMHPSDKGTDFVWHDLHGAAAYSETHAQSANPFLACPLNLCLYYLAEKLGVSMVLHQRSFDHGAGLVRSRYEFTDTQDHRCDGPAQPASRSDRLADLANWQELEKSRFIAHASHDLRQPLQAATIFAEVLAVQLAGTAQQPVVDKLRQSLGATHNLLNALLDAAVIDSNQVRPHPRAFPLGPLLDNLYHQAQCEAAAKKLDLRVVPSRAWGYSDPVLLERLLRNLVLNAIRYTRDGGVVLGCRHRGHRVALWVADSGIGIEGDKLDAIFDDFTRLDDGDGRSPGFGLGLGVVRRMAVLLNHSLEVRSIPGKGSIFAVVIDRGAAAHP